MIFIEPWPPRTIKDNPSSEACLLVAITGVTILVPCHLYQVTATLLKTSGWNSRVPNVNSLAPGRFQFHFKKVILKLALVNGGWGISYEIDLRWMLLDLTDDKSTLVQVMAWCRQAPSHYLSQCWPRSMSPNGVTRPQWVNMRAMTWLNCETPGQWSELSHNWTQCWLTVDWTVRNTFQWNCSWNSNIFIQEKAFENVWCKVLAI